MTEKELAAAIKKARAVLDEAIADVEASARELNEMEAKIAAEKRDSDGE